MNISKSSLYLTLISVAFIVTANFASAEDVMSLKPSKEDILGMYKDKRNAVYHQKAMRIGCRVVNLPDHGTFFVYWLPDGFEELEEKRTMVILHGQNGNACRHLLNFCEAAQIEKYAVISVQWGWPKDEYKDVELKKIIRKSEYYQYLEPDAAYEIMRIALDYMEYNYGVDKHISAWHGFKESSTQCAIYAFYDKEKNNLFKLFIAASGVIDPDQRMMKRLRNGVYGKKPLQGKNFYLWCSKKDKAMCEGMKKTKSFIGQLGGRVNIFRTGPEGHSGFEHSTGYQREAVELWKGMPKE